MSDFGDDEVSSAMHFNVCLGFHKFTSLGELQMSTYEMNSIRTQFVERKLKVTEELV